MSLMLDHTEDFELISEDKEKFKSARWNVLKESAVKKNIKHGLKLFIRKQVSIFLRNVQTVRLQAL